MENLIQVAATYHLLEVYWGPDKKSNMQGPVAIGLIVISPTVISTET